MARTRFMVVTAARFGSNQFVDYINQAKVARCLGEIFKKDYWEEPHYVEMTSIVKCFSSAEEARKLHHSDLNLYWDIISKRFPGEHNYIGAKLFYTHRPSDDFWNGVIKRNQIIIHLWRNRILESFVSLVRAETTNKWQIKNGSRPFERNAPIVFDEDRYLSYRTDSMEMFRRVRNRAIDATRYYEIEYSKIGDIVAIGSALNEIFETQGSYASTLVKQGSENFLVNVENRASAEKYVSDRLDA